MHDSPFPTPEERAIVDRARGGDPEAFRALVESCEGRVFRLAKRVLRCNRQTAEDVTQDVFMRAYRGLPGFDGEVKFSIWLHRIALNASFSEYRRQRTLKRGAHRTYSMDAPVGGGSDDDGYRVEVASKETGPLDRVDQREFADAVRVAIAELPEHFRDPVVLRDLQGLDYEEIGEVLQIAAGTVRSRIHRGRLLLQEKLKDFV